MNLACSPTKLTSTPTTVAVLSYSSMSGQGSLGEFLIINFPKFCEGCRVEFHDNPDNASLFGNLKTLQKRNSLERFDVVMGLDESEIGLARGAGLIGKAEMYDQSPMAILADTKVFPPNKWPTRWKDLSAKHSGRLLVQDPRLSSPGLLLLRTILQMEFLTLRELQKSVGQNYPSWSASYEAFTHGAHPMVWTYLASEAYHRCNDTPTGSEPRYRAIPLIEGYPMQKEYAALVAHSKPKSTSEKFLEFLSQPLVQAQIPQTNWMLPARADATLPECFKNLTKVKTFDLPAITDEKTLLHWKDLWSQ